MPGYINQKQVLVRINNLLEQALRESMHLDAPNTLDVQINRIRKEACERIDYQNRIERKGD